MRDPARIGPTLDRLRRVWAANHDLRLGQMVANAVTEAHVYHVEDEELVSEIEAIHPARLVPGEVTDPLAALLAEVAAERARQDSIFGVQQLPDGTGGGGRKTSETIARNWCDRATREGILTFADILDEETAEALAETDPVKLRVELVQVAAVALKWIQDLDRRAALAKFEGGA